MIRITIKNSAGEEITGGLVQTVEQIGQRLTEILVAVGGLMPGDSIKISTGDDDRPPAYKPGQVFKRAGGRK